jgi:hypothetical protein
MRNFFLSLLIAFIFISCQKAANDIQREFMPTAKGETGEIILVMDSAQWEGALGDVIKQTFREPVEGLPQDEPIFSISKASPKRLNSVLRSAQNMVFVMTLDKKGRESNILRGYFTDQSLKTIQRDSSMFMTVRRDEFARGQVVLYLFSASEDQLIQKITANKNRLQEFFESVERERIRNKLFAERERQLEKAIAEDHEFQLNIPFGWDLAKNVPNFIWLRKLDADREQDVFVYYGPYNTQDVFSNIPQLRDGITEQFLRDGENMDVYITRQERDDIQAIFTETVSFNGKYAVKARGLWKISDNSGGGPYIIYTFVDDDNQRLYYIEGYVYSPGTKKSNMIREVDAILSTFRIQ